MKLDSNATRGNAKASGAGQANANPQGRDLGEWRWNLLSFAIACMAVIAAAFDWAVLMPAPFLDARSYWLSWHSPTLYDAALPLSVPHFIYGPPAALVLWPVTIVPVDIFVVAWAAAGIAAYVWLLYPLALPARITALAATTVFALNGNIEWLLALVTVIGMRQPVIWVVALFTKVVPFVGFGWFVIRRDWRSVALTGGVAAFLAAGSWWLLPGAWETWLRMLSTFTAQAGSPLIPYAPRVAAAAVLLLWGAWLNRPAVLPFVLLLAQPDIQPWALGYLAALPRLRRMTRTVSAAERPEGSRPALPTASP